MGNNFLQIVFNILTFIVASGSLFYTIDAWRHATAPAIGYLVAAGFCFTVSLIFLGIWVLYFVFSHAVFKESYFFHYLFFSAIVTLLLYYFG
ncbi:hypothetical protein AUK10_02835 [Candidatus Gracilibacteria bacterium CG2_30_37_12]|nr:MAG: hypothetical protein AUK10_02835 [Candidatus Gracilibacteria bacterium CG2_30_37_12]